MNHFTTFLRGSGFTPDIPQPLELSGVKPDPQVGKSRRALPWVFALLATALVAKQVPPPVTMGSDGQLVYQVADNGDRVPDFSSAGYGGGGVAIPFLPSVIEVAPVDGDDGARIQAALDWLAAQPADAAGLRGAVRLTAGRYDIGGQLKLRASGIVLRGAGNGPDGTVLVATGTERRALIEIVGTLQRTALGPTRAITDDYVPVGATSFTLDAVDGLVVGQRLDVERPSPAAWIQFLGMDVAPARQPYNWKPDRFNLHWDRVITAIDGHTVTLDAPITTALEARWGGGKVQAYSEAGYISQVGVEHLRCEAEIDAANPHDEQHAWNAIDLHAVRDGWISDVVGVHFAGSIVQVGAKVERVTVQDCASLAPKSELAGYRRLAFHSRGQQTLFLRCTTEDGLFDFTVGYQTGGPNVFLECRAVQTQGWSGSIGSWSSGLLFDQVSIDGGILRLDNMETWNQGVGWAAANSVIWDSEASKIIARTPPGAHNWANGVWGQFVGDAAWSMSNEFAHPPSLYRAQLADRVGPDAINALAPRTYTEHTLAAIPSLEQVVTDLAVRLQPTPSPAGHPLSLRDGVLFLGDERLTGRWTAGAWWLGRMEPGRAKEFGPAITRFAPGRTGMGLTDELPAVADWMERQNIVAFRHHYGLWHERRRIDHQMIRRPDSDVWPPFFEQPFARSGTGRAWDGLSRYDLTRYNPWYFQRLRDFADVARERGLVLINEMYFQHNIIESGAHWVDSPWRPVNNINDTSRQFPEPPPFTGDTIKMADEFYDLSDPTYRALHRAYIRQCLDNLAGQPNVIHSLSAENTGPLHFMQFWIDVVAEWELETGQHPLIALSATKDVQDAILADPARAAVVDIIDFTYWFRTAKGDEYAPAGGISLAPRQNLRKWKGGQPNAASIAAMADEYRARFPGKAIITSLDQAADIQL
ncbi:DUF6298 domain-containing protein [Actomonas aquatica]|uniref:DUF6298 domain-containing protein n=1 Tax=Actomonas aquatica TaxID=2866162 RepID=A0ABZ1CA62_9BACT|nr:DUF6298 domain-containing protein [Opitutus sp. WL0086]WRQ88265.1 DUF6298 domain-containing protein [Opitutus sp. WL0086]